VTIPDNAFGVSGTAVASDTAGFCTVSLPHALVTALIERPCSGSELAGRFDRSIGYFWQATHRQIHRELARLEAAGWIEGLPHESGRGRKQKYQVLPAGRDELLVRLRAAAVIGPTRLAEELERLAAHHREKLAAYQKIETRDFPPGAQTQTQRLRHLVLKAGIEFESQRAAYCEEAIAILRTH